MIALVAWIAVAGCTITGTPGADTIIWIDGGTGIDRAWVDRLDRVFAVERHG